ncbi:hypothetical protein C8R44DRAFT_750513 [Mycena epipterygia]|nr:hypothetical protein C8R44DRAFT_750513 [Mycena epipterygia]
MAIVKSRFRTALPTTVHVGPMHAVRAHKYDSLNCWLALANIKSAPQVYMHTPLPDDQAMYEVYVSVIEGILGTTYRLSVAVYHPRVDHQATNDMHLARFIGSRSDANVLLWVRRLPPHRLLGFVQPLAFVERLVGGKTDIPIRPLIQGFADEVWMKCWARNALENSLFVCTLGRSKDLLGRGGNLSTC